MRFYLLLFTFFFLTTILPQEDPYKAVAEEMPAPADGYPSIYKKIIYPTIAKANGIEGKVYLLVYVNENGGVDDVKVVKGIGGGCDDAAIDVIKKVKFIPGKVQGQPTKVKLTIPFTFKIK